VIEKRGSKWCLLTQDKSKVLGCHDSESTAQAQERAVEAAKQANHAAELAKGTSWAAGAADIAKQAVIAAEALAGQSWEEYAKTLDDSHQYDQELDPPEVFDLKDVEVFATGKHNGDEYTEQDLDLIVQSAKDAGYTAPLKLGHDETPGKPAVGWVENLRRAGGKLVADITNIPKTVYDAIKQRGYDRVSSEVYWNLHTGGKTFKRALKAVALLGADVPAVTSLKPLHELFSSCTGIVKNYDVAYLQEGGLMADAKDGDECKMDDGSMGMMQDGKCVMKEKNNTSEKDAKIAELTAKVTELSKKLDEGNKSSERVAALEAQLKETTTTLTAMGEERRQERIKMKANSCKLPAMRTYLQALLDTATRGGEASKVVKFSMGDGKTEDRTPEAIIDGLISYVNGKAEKLFTEMAREDGEREHGDDQKSAAEEVHDKTLAYCMEHKLDPDKDYQKAMTAVFKADPALKTRYATPTAAVH